MARVVLGSYMVRYPLGGMMSWALQYLLGLQQLGHEVYFVEKSGFANSCFDPARGVMSDDCSYGTRALHTLLARFSLGDRWCYVGAEGRYHGLSRERIERVFDSASLFLDMGTHGAWLDEAAQTGLRVLIDGEPGFTQMKMELRRRGGEALPEYDAYYTTGPNVGTARSSAPTAGVRWGTLLHPVATDVLRERPVARGGAFTTLMNWQSYEPLEFDGKLFGHKDVSFAGFEHLPRLTDAVLELAVAGRSTPRARLREAGWRLTDPLAVSLSVESFYDYVAGSRGEVGVCKHGFVATRSGWFSDRSAAYLASGRPVVLEETGFSDHLPCGEGLFAVRNAAEAAAAIEAIEADYDRNARTARAIAREYLDTRVVLARLLAELGVD